MVAIFSPLYNYFYPEDLSSSDNDVVRQNPDQGSSTPSPAPLPQERNARVNEVAGQVIRAAPPSSTIQPLDNWFRPFIPSINSDSKITFIDPQRPRHYRPLEVEAVATHLKISILSRDLAVITHSGQTFPHVLYHTADGKVRIYEGDVTLNSAYAVYREYNSIYDAVADFEKKKALVSLCEQFFKDLFVLRENCLKDIMYYPLYLVSNYEHALSYYKIDAGMQNTLNAVCETLKKYNSGSGPLSKALVDELKPRVEAGIQCLLEKMNAKCEPRNR